MGTAVADGQPVNGRSRDLGIAFETAGGAKWCAPTVVVKLTAPNAAAYNLDNGPFAVMLGRIRAIVVDQCPHADLISFEGTAAGQRAFLAELSRLTLWRRFVALDAATQKPVCQGPSRDGAECDKRAAAYVTAKRLMRGPHFAGAELVIFLDTGAEDHLTWQTATVAGKLQLTSAYELAGQFNSAAALADAVVRQSVDACASAGGQPGQTVAGDYVGDLAYRSVACQPAAGLAAYQVSSLIALRDGWFYIFGLSGEGNNIAVVDEMAGELLKGIGSQ